MVQGSFVRRRLYLPLILACALAPTLSCVKMPRRYALSPASDSQATLSAASREAVAPLVNLNAASPSELEKLPGIGRALAARIILHREQYGSFRRREHLMMVRGIGARRFQKLSALVTVE
jgi:competence ComEA-like helix-hairpin-helix protein